MARKQSVILTPAEKKAAVSEAKIEVKEAKAKLAGVGKARKALDSEYTKAVKVSDRARKALDSEYAKAVKASDRDIAAAQKAVTRAEAELLKINPPPAPKAKPSPVGV